MTPLPNIIPLHSLSDPALGLFTRLTEAQLRNRLEPEKGIFIAESPKVIRIALDAGYEPAAFLMERKWIDGQASDILARCGDTPVYTAGRELLEQLTGYALTRGVLCAMRRPASLRWKKSVRAPAGSPSWRISPTRPTSARLSAPPPPSGWTRCWVTPCCCDPLNRRAVRVSMGTVFQIPWTRLGSAPSDWPHPGLETLRALGFKTAAMALREDSVSMDDPRLLSEEKLAVVLGTEGDGLSSHTIAACDYTVRIPMARGVDSLNVAAASAVAFWQLRAR